MATPSIPHFGTTLYEAPPAADADQSALPFEGQLARTDRFLTLLGAETERHGDGFALSPAVKEAIRKHEPRW